MEIEKANRSSSKVRSAVWGFTLVALVFAAYPAVAQMTVTAGDVECVPVGDNAPIEARVDGNLPETEVRLYFRRLHDTVEDFYYTEMMAEGSGNFWGTTPKPEDVEISRHAFEAERAQLRTSNARAQWWKEKEGSDHRNPTADLDADLIRERASVGKLEKRHWMLEMDDATFEDWLARQTQEPAEYFVSVHDAQGQRLARSETKVASVRSDCPNRLSPEQRGYAENMTIGETAQWQRDEQPFHWMCDGVVSRQDQFGIYRADDVCRACVVAWWRRPAVLIPLAAGAAVVTGIIIADDDPEPASPISP